MNKQGCLTYKPYRENINIKLIFKKIMLYIIMIPYLYPRGFVECYPFYKKFFTVWMYVAIILEILYIFMRFIKDGIKYQKIFNYVILYYGMCILLTLYNLNGLGSGLQKMFAGPILCIFYIIIIREETYSLLVVTMNIMIVEFLLNLTLFNPNKMIAITGDIHMNFLGHVQIYSEFGILALYISYILIVKFRKQKVKGFILSFLSLLSMIASETDASMICIYIIVTFLIISCIKPIKKLLLLDSRWYVVIFTIISILIVLFNIQYLILNTDFTFNGRTIVWKSALELIASRKLFGYGIQGVFITTFWGGNMNYAHNQFLQNLLDGGSIVCFCFYLMLLMYTREVKKVKNNRVILITNIILICYMFLMIFESVGEYFYYLIFLSITVCLPQIFEYE